MGHFADKVKELAKERFFWTRMEKDIRHFIRDTCSCLKKKKSNITKVISLKAIPSIAPGKGISEWFYIRVYQSHAILKDLGQSLIITSKGVINYVCDVRFHCYL